MTSCCSLQCEKKYDCAKHCFNKVGTHPSEDYSTFGHDSISKDGCTVKYWCGELGDYKMFEPVDAHNRCEYCKDGKTFIGAALILGNDGKWHKINHCPNCGAKMMT